MSGANPTVARLGGDEFGVILENCSSEHATRIADYLRKAIAELEFVWSDAVFTIGVSIGVVDLTPLDLRLTQIMSAVDSACYVAKDQGRNRVQLYNPNDTVVLQRHGEMQWVSRIKRALEENRFHLYYQLIVPINPALDEDNHYEILIRMEDKRGRIVLPGEFLPAAERYNLAVKLDAWIFRKTLSWVMSNPEHIEGGSQFFVNLSGDSLGDESFHKTLLHSLKKTGLPPRLFCFEITETAAIANISSARAFIDRARSEGCQFALDDFGSGLSSFAYLKNLPVDYIKIDGIFIRPRMEDKRGRIVLPGEFLPAAERYNLAVKLDAWIFRKTLSWVMSNPEHIEGGSQFFVNLSGDSLGDESFHKTLLHSLKKTGLPPRLFCFEITETAAIANISSARAFIDRARSEGCQFALDDFGSGLSSFAYLKNLPVDYIKIDGIFIRDVDRNPVSAAMVKSINEIGHVMGKKVIAEHVENKESLACLKSMGIDYAQGYALAKPRPIAELGSGKSVNDRNVTTRVTG